LWINALSCNFEICMVYLFIVGWRVLSLAINSFSVAGPTVKNSLPDHLCDPAVDCEQFRWDLKTYLFAGHL